jgi:CheY-specific phosphatase CheX
MQPDHAQPVLSEAARNVLETMCFVDSGELPGASSGGPEPICLDPIGAQVEFRGHWTGRCIVEMPETCARMIAGNFMGLLDPNEVDAGSMIELLCEFVNMVCGSTITRLKCPGLVTLSPPHLISEWPSARLDQTFECWLDTGDGILHVGFETGEAI